MKYMGSKRAMLGNGLGETILAETKGAKRFLDIFCGSGAVAWFAAQNSNIEVMAFDLQQYAVDLTNSVIRRTSVVEGSAFQAWQKRFDELKHCSRYQKAEHISRISISTDLPAQVRRCREFCAELNSPVAAAYGGYYFSPVQAITIDAMRAVLPKSGNAKSVLLASLIQSASQCAAAPGHTAQPFKPNSTAGPYLVEAWNKNIFDHARSNFARIAALKAMKKGNARRLDANKAADEVCEGDIVFVDPPYSAVHYSRFYHVLETISRGVAVQVEGTGRYPPPELRPRSKYSVKSEANSALENLFDTLGQRGARVILTFPQETTSNGLSGHQIEEMARSQFKVVRKVIASRFSTLGGHSKRRTARSAQNELILCLSPVG